MTKYETDFTKGAYELPTPTEVAAAERAYARDTRRLGASIAAWNGDNPESEWMFLDADMCEHHADIVEAPNHPDSYEAYMHIVAEYQAMLDEGAPASGIILYLPHKYIEQLNERRREMVENNNMKAMQIEYLYKEFGGTDENLSLAEKQTYVEDKFALYREAASEVAPRQSRKTAMSMWKDSQSEHEEWESSDIVEWQGSSSLKAYGHNFVEKDYSYNPKSGREILQESAQQALEDYKGKSIVIEELSKDVSTLLDEPTLEEEIENEAI